MRSQSPTTEVIVRSLWTGGTNTFSAERRLVAQQQPEPNSARRGNSCIDCGIGTQNSAVCSRGRTRSAAPSLFLLLLVVSIVASRLLALRNGSRPFVVLNGQVTLARSNLYLPIHVS